MRIDCTCTNCGAVFQRWPSQVRDRCSRFCRYPRLDPIWSEDGLSVKIQVRHPRGEEGWFATVDAEDFALVSPWKWGFTKGYAEHIERADGRVRKVLMHRLILGLKHGDGLTADHIDRDRLNNLRSNLRIVTTMENGHNRPRRPGATSISSGVQWCTRAKKWRAAVRVACPSPARSRPTLPVSTFGLPRRLSTNDLFNPRIDPGASRPSTFQSAD